MPIPCWVRPLLKLIKLFILMRRIVYVLSLGFACLAGNTYAQVFNNNYYFSPSDLPNYSDLTTVKATELVNEEEIMTVGYAVEPTSTGSIHDIVIVKTKSSNGAVIWANRYGLEGHDEKAFGLTVSYDGKHVIVVGTAQSELSRTDWNALVMKVEISSGNVIWSNQYGTGDEYQEFRMVQRSFDSFTTNRPTYTIVGSSTQPAQKAVLYAVAVHETGVLRWSNLYLENSAFDPLPYDLAFTMVRNWDKNFIITGTRYQDNNPTKIFTIGISPATGAMTDKYIDYNIDRRDHFEGGICTIDLGSASDFQGYGLTFTTVKPEVESGVDEAISVVVLDKNREPLRTYLYWQEGHQYNNGLSIYQNTEDLKALNVYTSTYRSRYNPGFLSTHIDGTVNYFYKFNVGESKTATAMEQNKLGYTAKALHADGDNGFLLARLAPSGKTECLEEQRMRREDRETRFRYREYFEREYGKEDKRTIKVEEVHGKMKACDGSFGQEFKTDELVSSGVSGSDVYSMYPNPLTADQATLQLTCTVEDAQQVEITIYNALGQQSLRQLETLVSGLNQLSLDASGLSTGVNLVTVRSGGKLVYQNTVIKE